jgi:fused signal recognition particle receptor
VVGVNGVGKTTTIGKLSYRFSKEGKKVMLAAGDTFRAAASEQLEIWSSRTGAELVKHQAGSDPAAVVFDAIQAAGKRGADLLIIDTAGRLHTKSNLMEELRKIKRIITREMPGAPHEVLLVLDATTGQNAIRQAELFREVTEVTGIVLAKLDGTAKGGIVLAIKEELGIPVKLVGVGEGSDDLKDFSGEEFLAALFGETEA